MGQRNLGLGLMAMGALAIIVGIVWLVIGDDGSSTSAADPDAATGAPASTTTTSTTTATTTTTTTPPASPSTTSPSTTAAATSTAVAPETESPEAFLAVLNGAFAAGDAATLLSRLNQATIDIYGPDACAEYLAEIVTTPQPVLAIDQVVDVGPWDYVIDAISTPLLDVTTVLASRGRDDEVESLELHWQLVDGSFTWFTDCGEPLPE